MGKKGCVGRGTVGYEDRGMGNIGVGLVMGNGVWGIWGWDRVWEMADKGNLKMEGGCCNGDVD